jgi:hypothetical protein
MAPSTTRLRFVSSKSPEMIQRFCDRLGARIQIYQITFADKKWFLWFVPSDKGADIKSRNLG